MTVRASSLSQKVGQLGDIRRNPSRLILAEQLTPRRPPHQREIEYRRIAYAEAIESIPNQHFTDGDLIDIALLGVFRKKGHGTHASATYLQQTGVKL
jgi:hypothetical protein